MRALTLALALLLVPGTAHAGGAVRTVLTLAGAYVGGASGLLVGTTAYGIVDPYGHGNSGEYFLSGGVAGFGLGAAVGGGLTHALIGGRKGGRVVLVCGLLGGVSAGAARYAPALYDEGKLSETDLALAMGTVAVAVVGVPFLAMAMSGVLGSREGRAEVALAPLVSPELRGLSLVVRI